MRVLIVEDEEKLARLLKRALSREGFAADVVGRGEDALWRAAAASYDAIVLDVMLPGLDGVEVCRRLRADEIWAPVLMLTARDSVRSRVAGLDAGADDYLTKPFSYVELLARLRALVRRGARPRPPELRVGDLRLDPASRRAWRGDDEVELSPKEFAVLETLMRRPGDVLSRFELLEHAWRLLRSDREHRCLPPRSRRGESHDAKSNRATHFRLSHCSILSAPPTRRPVFSLTRHRHFHESVRPATLRMPRVRDTRDVVCAHAQNVITGFTERGRGRGFGAGRGRASCRR
jgi:two-component system OmpR family response regulator